jgi:hypothetical protein
MAADEQSFTCLLRHFGAKRLVNTVTHKDALAWRKRITSNCIKVAKTPYNKVKAAELVGENPFRGIPEGSQVNSARNRVITRSTVAGRHRVSSYLLGARLPTLKTASEKNV